MIGLAVGLIVGALQNRVVCQTMQALTHAGYTIRPYWYAAVGAVVLAVFFVVGGLAMLAAHQKNKRKTRRAGVPASDPIRTANKGKIHDEREDIVQTTDAESDAD